MSKINNTNPMNRADRRGTRGYATRTGFFRPRLEGLEDRTLLAHRLGVLPTALGAALGQLNSSVQAAVLQSQTALPVLNQPLSSVQGLTTLVGQFQSVISTKLASLDDANLTNAQARATLQSAVYEALVGAGLLGDTNGDTVVNLEDVFVPAEALNLDAGNVTIEVRLTRSPKEMTGQTFRLGTGLPGFPLEVEVGGELSVLVGFDYKNLKFGLHGGNFFLDTTAADELTASVTATLKNTEITGLVGFLDMKATPDFARPTRLQADIRFDVQGAASNLSVGSVQQLGGRADINLKLLGTFTDIGDFKYESPSIDTDFQLEWDLNGSRLDSPLSRLGAEPSIHYRNVRVSMGQFLGSTLAPILKDIQTALKPLQPIFTALNYRIPGLSDLMEAGGQGPVSLLTLAKTASSIGVLPPHVEQIVNLTAKVNEINTLVNSIAVIGNNAWLPVGSFNLNETNGDLRGLKPIINGLRQALFYLQPGDNLSDLKPVAEDVNESLQILVDRAPITPSLTLKAKEELKKLTDKVAKDLSKEEDGLKVNFPLVENPGKNALGLLLGRDADFVTFTADYQFKAKVEESYKLFSFLGAEVRGFLRGDLETLKVRFKVGYDSFGMRQHRKSGNGADLAKGFYIDTEEPLVNLKGSVRIGLAAEIPIIRFTEPIFGKSLGVSAGVEFSGGLFVDGQLWLTGPPDLGDHRFRISETADRLFETTGAVTAGIKFEVVAHTPFPILDDIVLYSKTIASHVLIDFNADVHKANPFKKPTNQPPEQTPVVVDLISIPEGNDGVPNQLTARIQGNRYQLWLYNGIDHAVPGFPRRSILLVDRPLDSISEIIIHGAGDNDRLTLQGDLRRKIVFNGRGGKNSLVVDARVPGQANTSYRFSRGRIEGSIRLDYSSVDELFVHARAGRHTSVVRELPAGTKLTINGNNVWNRFVIGEGHLSDVLGDLVVRGGNGHDELSINDSGNFHHTTWIVNGDNLQRIRSRLGFIARPDTGELLAEFVDVRNFSLQRIESLTIRGGRGLPLTQDGLRPGNRYEIHRLSRNLRLVGEIGSDTYVLGDEAIGLDGLANGLQVSISDRGGEDTLIVNDRGASGGATTQLTYSVGNQTLSRQKSGGGGNGSVNVTFSPQLEDVQLYGARSTSSRYNVAEFRGSSGLSHLSVFTGSADDRVNLGTYATGLSRFGSRVTLHDLGGNDQLTVNGASLLLGQGTVGVPGGPTIAYTGLETLFTRVRNGNHTVKILGLDLGVRATILGANRVELGGGNLADVRGSVIVRTDNGSATYADGYRGNATTILSFNDSLNSTAGNYALGASSFTATNADGNPIFSATFGGARVRFVYLYGGSGGNSITLADTQPFANTLITRLYAGSGSDSVNVETSRTNVIVYGQGGEDVVNLGKNGNARGILGQVMISNVEGWSTIHVDNSADLVPRAVRLDRNGDNGTIVGLAPGAISYHGWSTRAVTLRGGLGNNTFEVVNTYPGHSAVGGQTTIYEGAGSDTINVLGTSSGLTVDPQGGLNRITIGGRPGSLGDLTSLNGVVTLRGEPGVGRHEVDVIDRGFPANFTYEMDNARLRRTVATVLGPRTATLHYADFPFATLDLFAGNGNNRFEIAGTPTATDGVTITSGRGVDSVELLGTNGDLNINLGAGVAQPVNVGNAANPLERLSGTITVTAATPVVASFDNRGTAEEQQNVIDRYGPAGVSVRRDEYRDGRYVTESEVVFSAISQLDFHHGRGKFQPTYVMGTPAGMTANVYGAAGSFDMFWVGPGDDKLLGPVNVYAQGISDNDFTYYYDYHNKTPHTYTLSTDPTDPTAQRIERDGAAPFIFYGGYQIIFYAPHAGGNTINVRSVPEAIYLNMVAGIDDKVTFGSLAPGRAGGSLAGILGPISFQGYGSTDVVFDDSGNLDPTPKRVRFSHQVSGSVTTYNYIEGLTGAGIAWNTYGRASISVLGGAADETYSFSRTSWPASIRIDGGGGVNALDYSSIVGLHGQVSRFTGEGDTFTGYVQDAVSGHVGSLSNGAGFAAGKLGQAFALDGVNDFVEIRDYPTQTPSSITLDAWVNPDALSGDRVIVSKSGWGETGSSWELSSSDGWLRFGVYQGGTARVIETDAAVISEGAWQHVAATFDASTQAITIYVNGVAVSSSFLPDQDATITAIHDTTNPVRIGSHPDGEGQLTAFWDGLIDEVGLFDRALSAAEVRKLFEADAAGMSAVVGDLTVNLRTGTATGLSGITNIRNVVGSAGNDVLVGNGGNVLTGGAGDDLLIAGLTASVLFGGEGDDLLIGGTTSHDANLAALDAILAEWALADSDPQTRLSRLRSGLLTDGQVFANGQSNSLFGELGIDAFFGVIDFDVSDADDELFVGL